MEGQNNDMKMKIKTICDFLFFDQYQDMAPFFRFKQCFQPLFNNVNISLEKVFKDICGENKKYITYQRLFKASKKNFFGDTQIFFDKLFKSILKGEKSFIGGNKENFTSFTTKRISSKRDGITKIQITNDINENIHGINIVYDNVCESRMYPKEIERDLYICLELALKNIDENSTIRNNRIKYPLINRDYSIDAITHIFGTINKESGYITSIGFKCISGNTVHVGNPNGDGFLFGQFGYKLHDIKIQMTEKGINRLEPGFKENLRKNICLEKCDEILEKDEIILDEEYIAKIKDKDQRERYIMPAQDEKDSDKDFNNDYCGKEEAVYQYQKDLIETIRRSKDEDYEGKYNRLNTGNKIKEKAEKNDPYKVPSLDKENNKKPEKKYKITPGGPDEDYGYKSFIKTVALKVKSFKSIGFDKLFRKYKNELGKMINNEIYENNIIEKYINITDENITYYPSSKKRDMTKTIIKMTNLRGETIILGKKDNQKIWKKLKKKIYARLFLIIGSIIKAKNIIENKIKVSFKKKQELYQIMEKNENLLFFITKKNKKESLKDKIKEKVKQEENLTKLIYKNVDIPDLNIEKADIFDLQKLIDNCKRLLTNKDIEKESKNKIENLRNLFIQQKNILMEEDSKKAKTVIIKKSSFDINKYFENEEKKREKAKEEEQKNLEKKMKEEEVKYKPRGHKIKQSIIKISKSSSSQSMKIFHNQEMPIPKVSWIDKEFPHEKGSLCPCDEKGEWIFFKGLHEDDLDNWETYEWCKIDDITDFQKGYDVFVDGATIEDIKQGDINNCYFLSALGSLCAFSQNHSDFLQKLFYIKEKSEEHVYGIYLFLNGTWKLVLIDDYFPYEEENENKQICFGSSVQNELWVALLEKAWAKVNGNYARIGCRGFMNEAFDVLTEAYTEQIDIRVYKNEKREDELWELLGKNKNYVLAAGTHDTYRVEKAGLVPGHAYTLINIYSVKTKYGEERLVKLKNPYGNTEFKGDWSDSSDKWDEKIAEQVGYKDDDEKYGIFYMSFSDFCKYFDLINIAKLESRYKTTFCKIKKNQAIKCQIIKMEIEAKNTHVYIQLYQKNPRILRKDGTYCSGKVMCFLILVDKEFKYIQSTTGSTNITGTHICIEANLEPGTYYIFSDVNYRNEQSYNNHGYMITFYSNNRINKYENVTDKVSDPITALEIPMYYYLRMNNFEYKEDKSGIKVFDSLHSTQDIPFRILCFVNVKKKPFKVKLDIKGKTKEKNYCLYNDRIASEFDTSVIKEIKPKNATTVLILENDLKCEYESVYEILDGKDERTYENIHPIFENEGQEFDDKGNLLSYYTEVDVGKGFTLGLENKSNNHFKLNLILKDVYDINNEYFGKENIIFDIPPKGKKVFNAKIKPDAKDPGFEIKNLNK